jgi:hypothetical protein
MAGNLLVDAGFLVALLTRRDSHRVHYRTRLMIIPTYWLAYMFQWKAPRFGLQMGGVVGEGISPVEGYLWIPVRNALVWIVGGTIIGMIIAGVALLIRRRGAAAARTA